MRKFFLSLLILSFLPVFSGCSVFMAMSGEKEPDFSYLQPTATREEVESQVGKPVDSVKQNGNTVDTYEYEMGDPPNDDRAVANLVVDVYSLTLYELIATPMELTKFSGEDYQIKVTYGADGKVLEVSQPLPAD